MNRGEKRLLQEKSGQEDKKGQEGKQSGQVPLPTDGKPLVQQQGMLLLGWGKPGTQLFRNHWAKV